MATKIGRITQWGRTGKTFTEAYLDSGSKVELPHELAEIARGLGNETLVFVERRGRIFHYVHWIGTPTQAWQAFHAGILKPNEITYEVTVERFAERARADGAAACQAQAEPWHADAVVNMDEVAEPWFAAGRGLADSTLTVPNPYFVLPLDALVEWGFATATEVREATRWATSQTPPVVRRGRAGSGRAGGRVRSPGPRAVAREAFAAVVTKVCAGRLPACGDGDRRQYQPGPRGASVSGTLHEDGMALGLRLASSMLAFALVAACAGQAVPSTTTPQSSASPEPSAPPASVAPRATANPCRAGLTLMEAFSQRMADDLASLRPLVTARSFDTGAALAAIRRVSATLTAYKELDERLFPCDQTVDLAKRVKASLAALAKTVARSLSAPSNAARVQRDASVALFKRLPEVIALSETAKGIADGLALDLAVAHVPDSSMRPIGALPALPTPRPTTRATARSGGSSGSGWTASAKITAAAYKTDAYATYDAAVRRANYEIAVAGFTAPGDTPEARQARIEQAKMEAAYNLMLVIRSHLGFMNSNRPAACFADAYAADIKVGNKIWAAAQYMLDHQGDGDLSGTDSARQAFLNRLDGYFSDCR